MKHKNKKYETKAAAGKFEIWKELEKPKEMESRKDIEHQTDIEHRKNINNMRFTARNDYAFKKLFGRAENIIILREFLSVVLELNKEELKDIVIENPAVGNYYADEKQGILDIKLTLRDGQKVNIEMQNLWESHYEKRTYFYWASRYLEKFEPGKAYQYLARCVSIHILGEKFPLTEELHSIYRVMNVKSFQPFSDDLEFHFLDLTKLKQEDDSELEQWLKFIETNDKAVREELGRRNAVMQYANEVMNQFYADKQERWNYEAAVRYASDRATLWEAGVDKGILIGEKRGEKRGLQRGEQQGRRSEKLQTARNMKADGMPISAIVKYTGLTAEQIAEL